MMQQALQFLQDHNEVAFATSDGLRVEYRVPAKLGDMLIPTLYQIDGGIIISLAIGNEVSAIIEFTV